jgi:predicted metal-dependent peptidase
VSDLPFKLRELGIGIGWSNPFLLPALSRITIIETKEVPTMGVKMDGTVGVNPDWAGKHSDAELAGVLCHEIMHLMMRHAERREGRTMMVTVQAEGGGKLKLPLWNIAADMAINHTLAEMRIPLPKSAVYPPHGMEGYNAEQLYDELAKEAAKNPDKDGDGSLPGVQCGKDEPTSGCAAGEGDQPGKDGRDDDANGGQPSDGQGGGVDPDEWEKIAAQARALAAGTESGNLLAKLMERRDPIRWEQLIRATVNQALATHGRDDQTWSKRSRRCPPGIILPGWKATKARVMGIIDASGSVGDDELARAIDQLQRVAEIAEARLYLIVHDHGVQTAGWVNGKSREALYRAVRGRGGTSFEPAYLAAAQAPGRFDAAIHLTDGEIWGDWPGKPKNVKRLVVALLGDCPSAVARPPGSMTVKVKL